MAKSGVDIHEKKVEKENFCLTSQSIYIFFDGFYYTLGFGFTTNSSNNRVDVQIQGLEADSETICSKNVKIFDILDNKTFFFQCSRVIFLHGILMHLSETITIC